VKPGVEDDARSGRVLLVSREAQQRGVLDREVQRQTGGGPQGSPTKTAGGELRGSTAAPRGVRDLGEEQGSEGLNPSGGLRHETRPRSSDLPGNR